MIPEEGGDGDLAGHGLAVAVGDQHGEVGSPVFPNPVVGLVLPALGEFEFIVPGGQLVRVDAAGEVEQCHAVDVYRLALDADPELRPPLAGVALRPEPDREEIALPLPPGETPPLMTWFEASLSASVDL